MKQRSKRNKNQYLLPTLVLFFMYNSIFEVVSIDTKPYSNDGDCQRLYQISIDNQYVFEDRTFNGCKNYDYYSVGGVVDIRINSGGEFIINGTTSFIECEAETGGGLSAFVFPGGILSISGITTFTDCIGLHVGGGCFIGVENRATATVSGICTFIRCTCLYPSGGGGMYSYVQGDQSLLIFDDLITFIDCQSSNSGGGATLWVSELGTFKVLGNVVFNNCSCPKGQGGGLYLVQSDFMTSESSDVQISGEMTFYNCSVLDQESHSGLGGGLCLQFVFNSTVEINKLTFTDCKANYGGGLYLNVSYEQYYPVDCKLLYTFTGSASFYGCEAQTENGGGMYIYVHNIDFEFNPTETDDLVIFDKCTAKLSGGGIYLQQGTRGTSNYNKMKFNECEATNGGGLFSYITGQGILTLDQSEFYKCSCNGGNGGGVYFEVNFAPVIQIKIQDTTIHDCEAITNSSSTYP
ncbi:MAG: hypothetical protein EZS28_042401, partial [Streblomastix strix]